MNAREIADALAAQADTVAAYLLPGAKRKGQELKAGSVNGEAGDSLGVVLQGPKRGRWQDFATEDHGDLLDLWRLSRRLSAVEALKEAANYLGVSLDGGPERQHIDAPKTKAYARPKKRTDTAPSAVRAWLHSRGLNDATIDAFCIGEQHQRGNTFAVFPYYVTDRHGEPVLINCKYRDIANKRGMRQEAGAEPCLFGWHLIDDDVRQVVITEGEIDAMTLHQAGIPALSVNQGAGNHQWLENDFDRLQRFDDLVLWFDDDEAGREGLAKLLPRLGIERTRVVRCSAAKDANEWLQRGATVDDFLNAVRDAESDDPNELHRPGDYVRDVVALLYPDDTNRHAGPVVFDGEAVDFLQFRPGETTTWTGINGHGKSAMLSHVAVGLAHYGEPVCIFSGEFKPGRMLERMVRQATGSQRPSKAYTEHTLRDWMGGRVWVFDQEHATIARLLEVFAYAARRYGVRHCVIDSVMMTDIPEGDGATDGQKRAMQRITSFARKQGVHMHLVAHPRKLQDERRPPGKNDVSGSSKFTDAADNVIAVWARGPDAPPPADIADPPDALLKLVKQRHGEVQHREQWLYHVPGPKQYSKTPARRPHRYVDFSTSDTA